VREVQTADQCTQGRIGRHMIESLGEDNRMREGHVPVQHAESSGVQRARGEEARNKVDIARGVSIGWQINGKVGDDLI
jgi:hypothetical protein